MSETPEKKTDAPKPETQSQTPEQLIDNAQKEHTAEKTEVQTSTKKWLDGLLSSVITTVWQKMLEKKGEYSPEYVQYVTTRLEDMKKIGVALKVKWFVSWFTKFMGVIKTLNPTWNINTMPVEQLTAKSDNIIQAVSQTEEKVKNIETQLTGGGLEVAGMIAQTTTEKTTLQALMSFEKDIADIKKTSWSPKEFQIKYHTRLVKFITDVGINANSVVDEKALADAENNDATNKDKKAVTGAWLVVAGGTAVNNTDKTHDNEWFSEKSHYSEDEKKYINEVVKNASEYEWTKYSYGWTTKDGIDCSWLWSQALKKEFNEVGDNFPRLTAALFDTKAPDIAVNTVEKWDWMFWEDAQGVKKWWTNEKWEKIYHIEMALNKPFEKDGKQYVLTYGSSSDGCFIMKNGKRIEQKNGVWYRERRIDTNKHHFARPEYYQKLVAKNSEKTQQMAA